MTALVVLAGSAAAGCARQERGELPVECRAGRAALRAALDRAPAPVRVDGVPISACFVRSGDASDIAAVGSDYLAVASDLALRARRHPASEDAVRLGYLVGAMRRGSARTQGIHDEMIRRIEQELVLVDTGSEAYRRGESAGRATG